MRKTKIKTYIDKLMDDKEFRVKFNKEYQNLLISEQIAQLRHSAHLTQERLAKRIHTTKSAVSRYESANYRNYSVSLLNRIASACGAELKIMFLLHKKDIRSQDSILFLKK